MTGISCQWYRWTEDEGYNIIPGATDLTYTTGPIDRYCEYSFTATDRYGTEENIWFTLSVQNHLKAVAANGYSHFVSPGETVTLEVEATADDDTGLTYQWYTQVFDPNYGYYNTEPIEGVDGPTYTTGPVTGYSEYSCVVTDSYGTTAEAWFDVGIENHLVVNRVGNPQRFVKSGKKATLKVTATADDMTGLTYQWYVGQQLIPGATKATYTTGKITAYAQYRCVVTDCFGTQIVMGFNVGPNRGLKITAKPTGITLKWSSIKGVTGSYIYRRDVISGDYMEFTGGKTGFTDAAAVPGVRYQYQVYVITKNGYIFLGYVSGAIMDAPAVTGVTNTAGGALIEWQGVEGAQSYRVYRKTGSKWKAIGTASDTSFVDAKAKSGAKYTYAVAPVFGDVTGPRGAGMVHTFLAAPTISSISNTTAGVKLTWKKIKGAAKYEIWRQAADGEMELFRTVSGTSFTDMEVASDTEYSYMIFAVSKAGLSSAAREGRSIVFYAAPTVAVSLATDALEMSWEAVPGAEGYRIQRKNGKKWVTVAELGADEISWRDVSVSSNKSYSYRIWCVDAEGRQISAIRSFSAKFMKPAVIAAAAATASGIKLTWKKVTGATNYAVWRRVEGSDDWVRIATTKSTSYTDTTAEVGVTYYYAVSCNKPASAMSGEASASR